MTRRDRRSKLRVLAAAASLLGAAAVGGALGLFAPTGGVSTLAQGTERSAPQDGGSDPPHEGQDEPASRAPEERQNGGLRRMEAPPHEQILAAASQSVDPSDPLRNCVIRPAVLSRTDLQTPVLAASYPGSGSRMLRHLIEALTGIATGDEWFRNTRRAVAIKTHYPHSHGKLDFGWVDEIRGAILLLRNPRDAIPSFCNHLYERKHGMTDHSVRAPLEDWVQWRNIEFRKQLAWWKDTVVHWVERFPADQRLVLTYEGLTRNAPPGSALLAGGGVAPVRKLAEFLSKSVEGLDVVPQKEMQCVWYKVVKYDDAEHEEGGVAFKSKRSEHPEGGSARPYTKWQLEEMMGVFRTIKEKFPKEGDIVAVMESYEKDLARNLKMHDDAKAFQEQQAQVQEQTGGEAAGGMR